MGTIRDSIDVKVPVRVAYDQWTQFEEFPRFMEGVKSVRQLDDRTLEWTAEINGVEKTWRAEIYEQEPDRVIAWRAMGGAKNAGRVTFDSRGGDSTRVTLELEVEPEGPVETAGEALGFVDRQVKEDLRRFEAFIESRGAPTGAWRGEIDGDRVESASGGGDRRTSR